MLYGIVQNGLLLVGKFYGVVYFGCTVCHGDSFRALRERYYRLDTKNLTSSVPAASTPRIPCSFGLHLVWQTYPSSNALCSFCTSGQWFASSFLQIPPRGGHPGLRLCAWRYLLHSGLSPVRNVPMPSTPKKPSPQKTTAVHLKTGKTFIWQAPCQPPP